MFKYEASKLRPVVGARVSGTTVRNNDQSRKFGTFVKTNYDTATIKEDNGFANEVWFDKDFRIEAPVSATGKRFILIAEINGKLAPATYPREYVSKAQAEHVALEMAEKHGQKMFVFESGVVAMPPVSPKASLVNL